MKAARTSPSPYTLGEELLNSMSHGIGAGLSVAATIMLIVLAVLTVLAGIALIILSSLEKKERQRIARRRAARERRLREQALEAAGMLPRSGGNAPADGSTRVPRSRE